MSNSSLGEAVLDLVADGGKLIDDINKNKPGVLGALDGLGKMGGKILAAGLATAATALVGLTALIWNAGGTIKEAYDLIAVETGAVGEELKGLQDDFDELFTRVPTNANDAAKAIGMMNTYLGLTDEALVSVSADLLEMTRLTGGDLQANGQAFARMMGDWDVPLEQASVKLDQVFVASQKTGIGTDRLMQLMVQFGAPMRQFGYSWETSAALLSKWEKEGVNTELVMGSLRIAAGKFARENIPLQDGLQKTFDDIKNAKDESTALAIAMDVFGARSGPDMAAAIRENRFEVQDLEDVLYDVRGNIQETAEATMDWGERWTLFKNRLADALGPAGMGLMGAVNTALAALEGILARPDIQNGLMAIVDGIVALGEGAAAHLPVLIDQFFGLVDWLRENEGVVVAILAVLGAAFLAFGFSVATAAWAAISPLLPIIAVIALIGAAAYLLYEAWTNNWGGIQDHVAALWAWLEPLLQQMWGWLAKNVPAALQTLSDFWKKTLLPAIQSVWGWMNGTLFPFLRALGSFIGAVFSVTLKALAGIWQNVLKPALMAVWSVLSAQLMPIFQKLSQWWQATGQPMAQKIAHWFGDVVVGAFRGLTNIIKDVTGWLKKTADMLNGMKLPDWMTPGSPTPWEIGLWGVEEALEAVTKAQLPSLQAGLGAMAAPAVAGGVSVQPAGGAAVILNYQPMISTADKYEAERVLQPLLEDFMRNRERR
jgi:hypothetical protein